MAWGWQGSHKGCPYMTGLRGYQVQDLIGQSKGPGGDRWAIDRGMSGRRAGLVAWGWQGSHKGCPYMTGLAIIKCRI